VFTASGLVEYGGTEDEFCFVAVAPGLVLVDAAILGATTGGAEVSVGVSIEFEFVDAEMNGREDDERQLGDEFEFAFEFAFEFVLES